MLLIATSNEIKFHPPLKVSGFDIAKVCRIVGEPTHYTFKSLRVELLISPPAYSHGRTLLCAFHEGHFIKKLRRHRVFDYVPRDHKLMLKLIKSLVVMATFIKLHQYKLFSLVNYLLFCQKKN